MSVWAFITMGYDKRQAKRKGQRIPEKNLWTLALLGGGIGAYFGMQTFRHKTRHTSFRIGFLTISNCLWNWHTLSSWCDIARNSGGVKKARFSTGLYYCFISCSIGFFQLIVALG